MNSQQIDVTVLTTAGDALPPNPRRFAVVLSNNGTDSVFISFHGVAIANRGIIVLDTTLPLRLTRHDLGEAIEHAMSAVVATGSGQLGIVESFA